MISMPTPHNTAIPKSIAQVITPLALVFLCQCGAPQPPRCNHVPLASRAPAASLLATARSQWDILADPGRRDQWPEASTTYNHAVARLFDQLRCGSHEGCWSSRAAAIGTRIAPADPLHADPANYDSLFPAGLVGNGSLRERRTTPGLGIALVGWRQTTPVATPRAPFLLPNGAPASLTALLDFDGPTPEWRIVKRWHQDDTRTGQVRHTVAADWTAPNAFFWRMCELDDLRIQNVLLPERFMEETSLYFLTPYDPDKIPVVMVHGLMSSPDAFKFIINELAPEPWFRENYQIWLFNYPTGTPWLYTGIEFRKQMRQAMAYARKRGDDRNLNRTVLVGHSMGGLLCRSSVTHPGTALYNAHFIKPIDSLPVDASVRELIRDGLLYQPLTEPSRCIFLAVPHQGSRLATLRATLWIENFIKLPKRLTIDLIDATLQSASVIPEHRDGKVRPPTSIRSLSPDSRAIIGLNNLPLPKQVRFHSIIGDRGKGGDPWETSDGVVPYHSSHITPIESEVIVPYHHGVPDHPDTAKEVSRILRLHLGESPP